MTLPDILEVIAELRADGGNHRHAARLLGAARALRNRMGAVRLKIYDAGYEACVAILRDALDDKEFDAAHAEGLTLSTEDAIAYAQRRPRRTQPAGQRLGVVDPRRERRRPTRV